MEDHLDFYRSEIDDIDAKLSLIQGVSSLKDIMFLRRAPIGCPDVSLRAICQHKLALLSRRADLDTTIRVIDRILASRDDIIVESDSTTENLSDLPGDGFLLHAAGDSNFTDEGQSAPLALGDFLARPVRIYENTLNLATDISLRLAVWDLFSKVPAVRAKMRNYAYFKGDLKIRIALSGSPFHYGRLLASYQPYAVYNKNIEKHLIALPVTGWRPLFLNYLSQAAGATTMNVNKNQPLELTCPFISPKPMFRLFNNATTVVSAATSFTDFASAGDLFLYTINQFQSASASPTNVYIQVYAWVENVDLGTSTATQIEITTESLIEDDIVVESSDERKTGPVENIASSAKKISDALVKVPIVSMYAKASSIAFGALRDLAAHFGWSKPVLIQNPILMKLEPFQNGSLTIGTDTNKRIVLDPKQELVVDPRVAGHTDDQMAISAMASRPSYYNTVTWATSSAVMATPIHIAKVTPCIGTAVTSSGVTYIQPTALAFSAAPFTFWRGEITYRFEVVCSAFHRGKLALIYEPNISQQALIVAGFDYNKQFIQIIDIQECDTFEVTIKWAGYRAWYQVTLASGLGSNQGVPSATGAGYANGFLSLTPFTKLQSPDGSSVSVNMYIYSKDMRYNQFTRLNLPSDREYPSIGLLDDIKVESEDLGLVNANDTASFVLNDSTATLDHISDIHFGEQPVSFRTLLKRYTTNDTVSIAAGGVANVYTQILMYNNVMPTNNMVYGAGAATWLDLYSYLKYAYLGMRGGIRRRIHLNVPVFGGNLSQVRITRWLPGSVLTPGTSTTGTTPGTSIIDGTVMYVPTTVGGVEVEFPFYTNNLFFFSFGDSFTQGVSNEEMSDQWTTSYILHLEGFGQTAAGTFVMDVATGEDFSFLRFQGAPFYSL